MKNKRILAMMLAMVMTIANFNGTFVFANSDVNAKTEKEINLNDAQDEITVTADAIITDGDNKDGLDKEIIIGANGITITLDNVDLANEKPIRFAEYVTNAAIVVKGTNTIELMHEDYAGINVPEGKALTITGHDEDRADCNLTFNSDLNQNFGANIGGNGGESSGEINISHLSISSEMEAPAAIIGGGDDGDGSNITISNSKIESSSTNQVGAVVGGGNRGAGNDIINKADYEIESDNTITATFGENNSITKDVIAKIGEREYRSLVVNENDRDINLYKTSGYGVPEFTLSHSFTEDNYVTIGNSKAIDLKINSEATYEYQWYKNTTNSAISPEKIDGATSESYTIETESLDIGEYYYFAEVKKSEESKVLTTIARVTILPEPSTTIDIGDVDETYTYGDEETLELVVKSDDAVAYKWYTSNDESMENKTEIDDSSDTYIVDISDLIVVKHYFQLEMENAAGTTFESGIAVVTILPIPSTTIDIGDVDKTYNYGSSSELELVVKSDDAVAYKWYTSNDENMEDKTEIDDSNGSYTVNISDLDVGKHYFQLEMENVAGTTFESGVAKVTILPEPVITKDIGDINKIYNYGSSSELELVVKSDDAVAYKWYTSNDENMGNKTEIDDSNGSYTVDISDLDVGKHYFQLEMENVAGKTFKSGVAKVTILREPVITKDIGDINEIYNYGSSSELELVVESDDAVTYEWYTSNDENMGNKIKISGSSNIYTVNISDLSVGKHYFQLEMENAAGTTFKSEIAEVTVNKERSSSGGPTTYSSKWDEPYTLTLNYNDGSAPEDIEYDEETDIDLSTYEVTREGYTFTGWYEDKDLENEVTEITLDEDKTLYAGWEEVETEEIEEPEDIWENPYIDVSSDDWFYDDVEYVDQNELMYGMEDDIFAPDTELSRGMIVTVLYRLAGEPDVNSSNNFEDIPKDAYYADAVDWANEVGITNGYTDSEFGPEDLVTREQLAVFFNNYADYIGLDTNSNEEVTFTDADLIAPWAVDSVNWSVDMGLISGYPDGSLNPAGTGTRAEFASILNRFNLETK